MSNGNFKVRCVNNENNRYMHTVGKIYEFKDGIYIDNHGQKNGPFESFEEFNNYTTSIFELVEEEPITITDILHKCAKLQAQGLNVSLTSRRGQIDVEHRNNETQALIIGLTTYDTENTAVLRVINYYLDKLINDSMEGK